MVSVKKESSDSADFNKKAEYIEELMKTIQGRDITEEEIQKIAPILDKLHLTAGKIEDIIVWSW